MRRLISLSRRSTAICLSFSLFRILTACKPPDDRPATIGDTSLVLSATLVIEPALSSASIVVALTDAGGEPITDATVKVVGNVTHADMQPVIQAAAEGEAGAYRADDFTLTMGGDWIITITATTEDGRRAEGVLLTTVPVR